ncbi:carboxypeptidase-like regulatory domain-containing protein [Archangium lansingense]
MAVDSRGQPLAGVHIQVASARTVQEDPVCGGERRGVSTGPDGRFAFRQLTGEKFVLTVSKQGYELAPSYGEFQRVEVKPGMEDVRVMLVQKTP